MRHRLMATSALAVLAALTMGCGLALPDPARAQDVTVPSGDTLSVPPDIDTTGLLSVLGTVNVGLNGDLDVGSATIDGGTVNVGTVNDGLPGVAPTMSVGVTGGDGSTTIVNGGNLHVGNDGDSAHVRLEGLTRVGSGSQVVGFSGALLSFQGTFQIDAGGTVTWVDTFAGGAGADSLIVEGTLTKTARPINFADGDDNLSIRDTALVAASFNGAGGTDTLTLNGTGTGSFNLTSVSRFEVLVKDESGSWTLSGQGSFEHVVVNGGSLTLDTGASLAVTGVAPNMVGVDPSVYGAPSTFIHNSTYRVLGSHADANDTATLLGTLQVGAGGVYTSNGVTRLLGGTLEIQAGGTYSALGGLTGVEGGSDSLIVAGTLNLSGNVSLGTGEDLLSVDTGATITPAASFDGGGDTDTLRLTGTGTRSEDMSRFQNFEIVEKKDAGIWTLVGGAVGSPATVQSIAVDAGTLTLLALWQVTGNTTTVASGSSLIVGDGGTQSALNEAGDLDVTGTLRITGNGSVTVSGTTRLSFPAGGSVVTDGKLEIQSGGTLTANGPFMTSGDTWSITVGEGALLDAKDTVTLASAFGSGASALLLVNGSMKAAGTFTVGGQDRPVVVQAFGSILVDEGAATVVDRQGQISVQGAFIATGPVTLNGNGFIGVANNGVFTASDRTTVNDTATLGVGQTARYEAGLPIVLNGGTLRGRGLVVGMVDNAGGTVLPGDAAGPSIFPGTLTIQGGYRQGQGGNYQAHLVSAGSSSLLAVQGTVELAGNVTVVVTGAFALADQVRILASDRSIDDMFETATLRGDPIGGLTAVVLKTDDGGLFKPKDGNNVDVLFVDTGAPKLGLSGNQAAVADALVGDLPVGGIVIAREDVLAGVLGMLADPNILEQVGPEIYDSFTTFSFEVARQFGGLIDARLRGLRCAAAGGALCGGSGPGIFASDRRDPVLIADAGTGARTAAAPGPRAPAGAPGNAVPGPHPSGWSVWASGLGAGLWKDRTSGNLGYSGWTTGGAAGVDLRLRRGFVLGVLAGATRSSIDFDGVSGDGDMDSVTTGVYAAWTGRRLFADAAFTYTKNWVEADRDISFLPAPTTADGKTEGDQYAVHATLGAAFRLRRLAVEASGGLDWVSLRQYGFTETGAGLLNLTVDSRTDASLRLRAGIRLARAWQVRPGLVIAPSVRVGYAREMFDNTRPVTATLAGVGGAFTVTGDDGGRDFLTFGGGLQAVWSRGLTLFVAQSGEWAQDRLALSFTGGLRVSW